MRPEIMIQAIWFAFVVINAFLLGVACGKKKAIMDLKNALFNGSIGRPVRIGTTCPACKGEGMVGVVEMVSMGAKDKKNDPNE